MNPKNNLIWHKSLLLLFLSKYPFLFVEAYSTMRFNRKECEKMRRLGKMNILSTSSIKGLLEVRFRGAPDLVINNQN
ncbi:MAG: hypothetical protein CVU84_16880 [Firmicutes bacterium HGW-Firmicutes-1]|jgi:hypothetical protein|nr:MAG: hypothetical protein CVU84_16880 [Firmicutes bacterium HGW-Firmicutes-1]